MLLERGIATEAYTKYATCKTVEELRAAQQVFNERMHVQAKDILVLPAKERKAATQRVKEINERLGAVCRERYLTILATERQRKG